jgi:hypothetical protein
MKGPELADIGVPLIVSCGNDSRRTWLNAVTRTMVITRHNMAGEERWRYWSAIIAMRRPAARRAPALAQGVFATKDPPSCSKESRY